MTINSMLEHITGNLCRGFVRAAVCRYNLNVSYKNKTHTNFPGTSWTRQTRRKTKKTPHMQRQAAAA